MSGAIGVIQGFHGIIGGLRGEPHWFVNDADAQRYGQAMVNAARHFPVKAAQKTIDVATLIMVGGAIEAPRIVRSIQLARQPKAPNRGPAQVFQFVPPSAPPNQPPTQSATSPSPSPPESGPGSPPIADGPPDLSAFGGEGA